MTAIEQLRRRLAQLPDDQREAMAAQVIEKWNALEVQTRSELEKRTPQAEDAHTDFRNEPVPYERIEHLVGSIEGPGDLSTNPKYMKGFGESARRQG